jgi:hypothetical protein
MADASQRAATACRQLGEAWIRLINRDRARLDPPAGRKFDELAATGMPLLDALRDAKHDHWTRHGGH